MIFAVIVTYNRLTYLKKLLESLRKQIKRPDKIIIVNNGSTDGTMEWLSTLKDIIVIHQENTGGSGGFHTGVRHAFENKAEWIWIMDDDVEPRPDCLHILFEYSSYSKCLNPVHYNHKGELLDEERWFDPESCKIINHNNSSFFNGKKIWYRNIGSFEGMLIAREIVEKIGLPDERFFIAHDDLIYGFLAHKFTNVAVIADAVIDRQFVNKSNQSVYAYFYYSYRNLWILEEYTNIERTDLTQYRKRRILWQFLYAIYKILKTHEFDNKTKALKNLYKAFVDYKKKSAGKTY